MHCKAILKQKFYDFFVFGHRHLAIDYRLSDAGSSRETRYINLGDWIHYYTYAVFDGTNFKLKSFLGKDEKIIRH